MKLATHKATGLLATLPLVRPGDPLHALAMLFFTVLVSNEVLDRWGHRWVNVRGHLIPARNRLHSLPGVLALAALFAAPFAALGYPIRLAAAAAVPLLVHYVEDLVTESGVYLFGRRIRLPLRVSYDSGSANKLTVAAFLAAAVPFVEPLLESPVTAAYAVASVAYAAYALARV